MLFRSVCVFFFVCVVMGLNRLISVSCVCVCVALCVEPVLEVEGEREGGGGKTVGKPRKTKSFG